MQLSFHFFLYLLYNNIIPEKRKTIISIKQSEVQMGNIFLKKHFLSIFCLLFFVTAAFAQNDVINIEPDSWEIQNGEIVTFLDRQCLIGSAFLKDVEFENGIIEVDIAVAERSRSYPGVIFRQQSEGNHERFYIRPHRSPFYPDALQYVPGINGIDGWQLYNGDGYTANIDILPNQWTHLKIEVLGKQARIFWGETKQPALVVTDLKHGVSKGRLGVLGPRNKTAYFSNFKYSTNAKLEFETPPVVETPPGTFTEWELSQPFKAGQIDFESTADQQGLKDLMWKKVKSEPSGLVDIARYTGRKGRDTDCIWAKTTIVAKKDHVKELLFGYSDAISIFLNGKILFSGNSAYRQRDPSFLGIVGLNDAVYLPLHNGNNELLLLIAESFGGWGFMCADGDAVFMHKSLTKEWELPRKLRNPESVVYDKKRDILYVTNYFNNGKEFISKVKLDGEIETYEWITGITQPTGMWIFKDKLYVVDRANLVEIDIDAGKILNKYPVPDAKFINDVAFDASGNAYISDTRGNVIHKFSNGKIEVWLEGDEIQSPNGLYLIKDKLLVGNSGDGCLKSVDLSNKKIETIACIGRSSNVDGIRPDGKGNYIISDYNGRVFLVTPSGEKTQLLNTTTPQYFCADLEYIIEKNLLIIPTLFENRIMTYRLK